MIKRFFDFLIASILLVILSPLLLIISLAVYVDVGKPIFFAQKRPGLSEKIFKLYKFRTMKDEFDEDGLQLDDMKRITSLGKILRETSLDELPSLINVFKGDMSLVGPRPLLIEYLELYDAEQAKRHNVRPGITGWAQINGRNRISWEEKFKLDVWYVSNHSLFLDLKIILKTFLKVFIKDGINLSDEITMKKFEGNNDK
mgnify:FL=1